MLAAKANPLHAPTPAPRSEDHFLQAFFDLSRHIAQQQITLLAELVADPALLGVFQQAGGDRELFAAPGGTRDDLDAIIVALAVARDMGKDSDGAREIAKLWLKKEGFWAEGDQWGGGSTWTDRRLALLFGCAFRSPGRVEHHTRKLIALFNRLREAEDHLRLASELLAETHEDIVDRKQRINDPRLVSDSAPRQTSVVVHIRRRKGNGVCRTI